MKYFKNIVQQLDKWETIYKGCSIEEVAKIQELAGAELPECYKEFLLVMGKDMDRKEIGKRGFLTGNSVFYEDLFDNKDAGFLELLKEDNRVDLIEKVTEDDFVFYDSQGVMNAFFKLSEGDNPPVYGYKESYQGRDFPKISDSLLSFYERYLEGDKSLFGELN